MNYSVCVLNKEKNRLFKKLQKLRKMEKDYCFAGTRIFKLEKFIIRILQKKVLQNLSAKQRVKFVERLEKLRNKYKKYSKSYLKEIDRIDKEIIDVEMKINDLNNKIFMCKR